MTLSRGPTMGKTLSLGELWIQEEIKQKVSANMLLQSSGEEQEDSSTVPLLQSL